MFAQLASPVTILNNSSVERIIVTGRAIIVYTDTDRQYPLPFVEPVITVVMRPPEEPVKGKSSILKRVENKFCQISDEDRVLYVYEKDQHVLPFPDRLRIRNKRQRKRLANSGYPCWDRGPSHDLLHLEINKHIREVEDVLKNICRRPYDLVQTSHKTCRATFASAEDYCEARLTLC